MGKEDKQGERLEKGKRGREKRGNWGKEKNFGKKGRIVVTGEELCKTENNCGKRDRIAETEEF